MIKPLSIPPGLSPFRATLPLLKYRFRLARGSSVAFPLGHVQCDSSQHLSRRHNQVVAHHQTMASLCQVEGNGAVNVKKLVADLPNYTHTCTLRKAHCALYDLTFPPSRLLTSVPARKCLYRAQRPKQREVHSPHLLDCT